MRPRGSDRKYAEGLPSHNRVEAPSIASRVLLSVSLYAMHYNVEE